MSRPGEGGAPSQGVGDRRVTLGAPRLPLPGVAPAVPGLRPLRRPLLPEMSSAFRRTPRRQGVALSTSTDAVAVGLVPPAHVADQLPEDFKVCKRCTGRRRVASPGGHSIDVTESRCREED